MRGEQHGVAFPVELGDELPQRLAQLDVDTGGRLVQHDDRRSMNQRLGDQHPALHATRQLPHVGVGLVGEPETVEQLVDPRVVGAAVDAHAKVAALDLQGFAHAEKRIEHQLLRHDAQTAPRSREIADDIVAEHGDGARGGSGEAGHDADQRRLARPVGAQQSEEFAGLDVEAHLVERLHAASRTAVALAHALEGHRRLGLAARKISH